jgi:N-acetylglucosamine-6-phosphate deacetylase
LDSRQVGVILLAGADVVLPDQVLGPGTVVVDRDRIIDILPGRKSGAAADLQLDLEGHYVVPGFVDVHVHGVEGHDVLDGCSALPEIAARLPRYGVTAFRPTTVACDPRSLRIVLETVARAQAGSPDRSARVLPAHLESNFISPAYRGAQPAECLRLPPGVAPGNAAAPADDSEARAILTAIREFAGAVGIVTLAPELPGALDLIRTLTAWGIGVSLGHSGASFDETTEAIAAGAVRATHLFNRMPPLKHREPGLAGAALADDRVMVELICDGLHVHPAVARTTVRAKPPGAAMAVSDGTAGSGLAAGSRVRLGGQAITVRDGAVHLDDGTLAGSAATMDACFRMLVQAAGLSLPEAAALCSTTPSRDAGLEGYGAVAVGAVADLVVLDHALRVVRTFLAGRAVFSAVP